MHALRVQLHSLITDIDIISHFLNIDSVDWLVSFVSHCYSSSQLMKHAASISPLKKLTSSFSSLFAFIFTLLTFLVATGDHKMYINKFIKDATMLSLQCCNFQNPIGHQLCFNETSKHLKRKTS